MCVLLLGQHQAQADPLSRTTTYAVDALGRRTSLTLDGRTEQWAYRPDGALAGTMDFAGRVTTFGYSPDGELTAIDYPAGTADVSYGYDAAGNVVSMSDGLGVTTYSYNVLNQMASRSRNGRTVSYAYTLNGQVGQIGYWNRGSVQVGYDAAGRLTGLAPWGAVATSYTYRSTGLLASETRPNSVNTAFTYDTASRLTGVNGIGYVLDANGNRIQMTDWEGVTTYSYDALDRLMQATYPTSTVTYTLDSVGNRLSDGMVSFAYDPSDRITNSGFTYDANGNLLADGAASYEYDAANRLIRTTRNGVVTDYGYDGWGNLVQETTNGVTTEFVLDENTAYTRILGEVRSDGGERLYAYGPEGFTAQQTVGGGVEYPLLDGLGSVRHLTDASGTVILSRSYDAYGNVRYAAGVGVTRLGYTGELQDPASGLVYLRARYYYPAIGRFLQRDSFGGFVQSPQSLNRYVYTENRPLKYTDPSGHDPCIGCVIPPGLPGALWNSVKPLFEDLGLLAPTAPLYLYPTYLGGLEQLDENMFGIPPDPSLLLTYEWYFELGGQSRIYGPDHKITQALMHDEGVEEARQYFVSHGRQDMLKPNTWHDYKFGVEDAAREYLWDVYLWQDWSTSFLGGYQVEVINLEWMIVDWDELNSLCNDGSLVEIRVHNTTGWASATRVFDQSYKQDEQRKEFGPGGNLDQTYIWRERIP